MSLCDFRTYRDWQEPEEAVPEIDLKETLCIQKRVMEKINAETSLVILYDDCGNPDGILFGYLGQEDINHAIDVLQDLNNSLSEDLVEKQVILE